MFVARLNEVLSSKNRFLFDRINFLSLGIAGLLNIIHWTILYIKIKPNQNNILLHYNVVYGADFIGKSLLLYWIPLLALIFLILNAVVGAVFYKKEKLASYFITISTVAVQVVFLAASIIIISING